MASGTLRKLDAKHTLAGEIIVATSDDLPIAVADEEMRKLDTSDATEPVIFEARAAEDGFLRRRYAQLEIEGGTYANVEVLAPPVPDTAIPVNAGDVLQLRLG